MNQTRSTHQLSEEEILKYWKDRQTERTAAQKTYLEKLPVQPRLISYEPTKIGQWEVKACDKNVPSASYFGTIMQAPDYRLQKVKGKDVGLWMSISPMELQSASIHLSTLIDVARSAWENDDRVPHFVIGGFGMGMFLINALYHLSEYWLPAKISVVELSSDIPTIIKQSVTGVAKELLDEALSGEGDIHLQIIHDDLLKMQPLENVDYMFVDIWQQLGSDNAREQSRMLKQAWKPSCYGYWGEEIDIAIYGQDLIDELGLSSHYQDEEILKVCDIICEAQLGVPTEKIKKKLGAIGEECDEEENILITIKDDSRNVEFSVPKYEDNIEFDNWYLNEAKTRIFIIYGDQFGHSFEVEYRFNEKDQTWTSEW